MSMCGNVSCIYFKQILEIYKSHIIQNLQLHNNVGLPKVVNEL